MTADEGRRELDEALKALSACVQKRRAPTRQHARQVLLVLGAHVLAERHAEADDVLRRLEELVRGCRTEWTRAVEDELALACTEFIQSVDPRYLGLPRYDFAYTVAARERVEARLAAASRMEIAPAEELLEQVARADALLAPYLRHGREKGPRA